MAVISPPWPPASTSLKWGLESNSGAFTSPLNKVTQSIARQGSRWRCTNGLALLNEDQARDWEGFFWLVQDNGYSFYWNRYPFNIQPKNYPQGETGGTTCDSTLITCDSTSTTCDEAYVYGDPVVRFADQTGKLLNIANFDPNGTLCRGDLLAFDNGYYRELHSVDFDATAGRQGNMVVSITPPIRITPAVNTPILLDGATTIPAHRCAGEFILAAQFNPADVMEVSVGYQFEAYEKLAPAT